jgi:DNA topoisomerase-3
MMGAIDAVCAQASRIIGRLQEGTRSGGAALPSLANEKGADRPPTPAMKRFVSSLAQQHGLEPPRGYTTSSAVCRAFLDQHAPKKDAVQATGPGDAKASLTARKNYDRRLAPEQSNSVAPPAQMDVQQSKRPGKPVRKTNARKRMVGSGKASANNPSQAKKGVLPPDPSGGDTPLCIPFGNKDVAHQLGARYRVGGWYAPPGVDLDGFRQRGWL